MSAAMNGSGSRRLPGLTTQIVLAFAAALCGGIFFGELIVPVKLMGDIFIGLLQMTVLPYIVLSLILNSAVECEPSKARGPEYFHFREAEKRVIRPQWPVLVVLKFAHPGIFSSLRSEFGTSIPVHPTAAHSPSIH
jgi:hypothetical protein